MTAEPSRPEASVIIPTRNRWAILSRTALPAALMQEDVSLEVILVDDGSDDATPHAVTAVGDSRVRVLRNETSLGAAGSRNRGIAEARGSWIAFLDDDDLWSPRKLRAQIDLAVKRGAGFVFSSSVTVDRDLTPTAYRAAPGADQVHDGILRDNAVPAGCSNVVVRADVLQRVGGYLNHPGNMALRTPNEVFREAGYFAAKHRRTGSAEEPVDPIRSIRLVAWENFWGGRRLIAARMMLRSGVSRRSWDDLSRGLRFLVMSIASSRLSRSLWRALHAGEATPAPPSRPEPPEWLEAYEPIASETTIPSPTPT